MSSLRLVTFNFNNNFEISIWCDGLPIKFVILYLEDCGVFYERVQHHKKTLHPMKEIPP